MTNGAIILATNVSYFSCVHVTSEITSDLANKTKLVEDVTLSQSTTTETGLHGTVCEDNNVAAFQTEKLTCSHLLAV